MPVPIGLFLVLCHSVWLAGVRSTRRNQHNGTMCDVRASRYYVGTITGPHVTMWVPLQGATLPCGLNYRAPRYHVCSIILRLHEVHCHINMLNKIKCAGGPAYVSI